MDKEKNYVFYFALLSAFTIFGFAEDGCASAMKIKNYVFYFALLSAFTIFGFAEDRMRFGHENKKLCLLFCIALSFHYLCMEKSE